MKAFGRLQEALGRFPRALGKLQELLEEFWVDNIDFSLIIDGFGDGGGQTRCGGSETYCCGNLVDDLMMP